MDNLRTWYSTLVVSSGEAPAATASASRSCKKKAMRKKRRSLTVPPETTPAVPEAETMQELIEKAKKRRTEVIAEAQTIPVVARPPLPPSPQPSGQGDDQEDSGITIFHLI
jgi:hypothetical protein